ncbi:MAG: hypothetical protein KGO81_09415 [Bacteroidota bacterium]|nr:hypothetical protein [Bacteroidota bacterium]
MEIFVEIIGWIASVLIVGSYFLNMRGKILATSPLYIWSNLLGGLFFVVNTFYHHAFPSMAVNIIWVLIAIGSLLKKKPSA